MLLDPTLQKAVLISWHTCLLDPGVSPQSSKVLHMRSNIVLLPTRRRRNMHPIYPHTHYNSSCVNHLMVPTVGMANYTNLLWHTYLRRLVLLGSTPLYPSRHLPSSSWPTPGLRSQLVKPIRIEWCSHTSSLVVGRGTASLYCRQYNLNPPPPSAPLYSTPTIPPISILTRSIIKSSNKLFFIFHSIVANDACKWCLV